LNNKGLSTVVAEILMVVIAVIIASAFVVGLQTNASSLVGEKDLASLYVWTTATNNWVNITAINAGGDAVDISGHVFLTYPNATTTDISNYLYFQYPNNTLHYPNGTLQYLQNGTLPYQDDVLHYQSGTLHYPNGTLQYPNGTTQDIGVQLPESSIIISGDFILRQLSFGQQFQVNVDSSKLSSAQLSEGIVHYIISSKDQILAEVDQKL
jgi:FlaG/FlaF family flagellin (archaellin)